MRIVYCFPSLKILALIVLAVCLPGTGAHAAPAAPLLSAEAILDVHWMPDSKSLAVNTDQGLVLVEPHGPRTLIPANGDLSPQGDAIVFEDPPGRVRLKKLTDGAVLDLGLNGARPVWSPAPGLFAYYASGECPAPAAGTAAPYCPPPGLVAADMAAGELVPLVQGLAAGDDFAWLPQASGVVYFHQGELGVARQSTASNTVLMSRLPFPCPDAAPCRASVAAAANAPRVAAFLFNDLDGDHAWTADDAVSLFAFNPDSGEMLYHYDYAWFLSGAELAAGVRPEGIAWRADGSVLTYVGRDNTGFFLGFVPFSGNLPATVLRLPAMPALPRWSPNGETLAYVLLRGDAYSPTGAMAELHVMPFANLAAPAGSAPPSAR